MFGMIAHYDNLNLVGVAPSLGLWAGQPGLDDKPELQHCRCHIKIYINKRHVYRPIVVQKAVDRGECGAAGAYNFFRLSSVCDTFPATLTQQVLTNLYNKRREGKA